MVNESLKKKFGDKTKVKAVAQIKKKTEKTVFSVVDQGQFVTDRKRKEKKTVFVESLLPSLTPSHIPPSFLFSIYILSKAKPHLLSTTNDDDDDDRLKDKL